MAAQNAGPFPFFAIAQSAVGMPPETNSPQFARFKKLATASWSVGGKTYVLAGLGNEQFVRQYLKSIEICLYSLSHAHPIRQPIKIRLSFWGISLGSGWAPSGRAGRFGAGTAPAVDFGMPSANEKRPRRCGRRPGDQSRPGRQLG